MRKEERKRGREEERKRGREEEKKERWTKKRENGIEILSKSAKKNFQSKRRVI